MQRLFLSNRLEGLFGRFKEWLLDASRDPFATRIVAVPHQAMKTWLQQQLAVSPDIGIAAGLQILTTDMAIRKLATLFPSTIQGSVPTRLELTIALTQQLPVMTQRRLLAQADELAGLFESYGRYGGRLIDQWKHTESPGWQESLWLELHKRYPEWCSLSELLEAVDFSQLVSRSLHVAVFGAPYIIPLHHRFLSRLSETNPVDYFVPSACQHFWSDILSPREERRLSRMLNKKGIAAAKQEALSELLQDTNPLLASLGKVGRSMARQLEESDLDAEAEYFIGQAFAETPSFSELVTPDTSLLEEAPSLLHAVQADLTLLRNPSSLDLPLDSSLQVHVSHSRIREVEALYNTLLGIIGNHSRDETPICPSDILVMAPDIDAYQILVDAVFGVSHSQLPYRVVGASWEAQSSFIDAVVKLLEIADSRWDAATLFQFWNNPHVREKHQLTPQELDTLSTAIQNAGITWGKDLSHRNAILERAHCTRGMGNDGTIGTWDHGIGLLLDALATGDPLIDYGHSELFGKWMALFHSLWNDLSPLMEGSKTTLAQWALYLKCLIDSYLTPAERHSQDDYERLSGLLDQLRSLSSHFPEVQYDASAFIHFLRTKIQAEKATTHEGNLQTIRFGDISSFTGEPARVIALLGLEDGAFPRGRQPQALDLLTKSPLADHVPPEVDSDRYAFLQVLQASRDYFILNYRGLCPSDGKEQGPALVVNELLGYLNRYYRLDGKPAGTAITTHHPYYPFDNTYFSEKGRLQGYREDHYRAALARAAHDNALSVNFLEGFLSGPLERMSNPSQERTVTIRDLTMAAKDPLRLYLNHNLRFFIRDLEDTLLSREEALATSNLDRYTIHMDALSASTDQVLNKARQEGTLPLGLFGDVALNKLKEDIAGFHSALGLAGTHREELYQIELTSDCTVPRQVGEKHWHLPPLQLRLDDGTPVKIVGKLPNLSPAA